VKAGLPAVLVASGGGFQGLAVLRLLGEADSFRIVVADSSGATVTASFADATIWLPPVAERAAFERALLELCRKEAVRLVLPSTDHELEALAEARAALEAAGTSVAVCDASLLLQLRDKQALYAGLAASGFPVLASWTGTVSDAQLPLIGKPRLGFGGRGVVVARTPEELDAIASGERQSRVWQPFLDRAAELSADFALLRDAAPPEVGLRRRVRTSGGFAVVSEGVSDPEALELVQRFAAWAAARGGRGLFNVQLLRQATTLVISDVNPRLGTSAVHWRGSGFNPVLAVCAEAGLLPAAPGPRHAPSDTRSVRHLEERIEGPGARRRAAPGHRVRPRRHADPDQAVDQRAAAPRLSPSAAGAVAARRARGAARDRGRPAGPVDRRRGRGAGPAEAERARLLEVYRATWPASCACYRDVKPALDALRRRGLRLGLLTDNPPETQRQKLQASGLAEFLDALVFARETGAEKPDARGFAAVAQALALPPPTLAMAGDNPHRDLAGAAGAGFARLFWVHREGAACSFDAVLAETLPGAARYERVSDLRQLVTRLSAD
jgi:FMN phosphatase YigB (HAD superfamily)